MVQKYKRNQIWWLRYTIDGKQRFESTGTRNEQTAELARSKKEFELDRIRLGLDLPEKTNNITVQQFYNKLATHINTRKTERTAETYIRHFDAFRKHITAKYIHQIDKKVINNYIDARLAEITPLTVNHELDSMRTIFNIAATLDLIKENPFTKLDRPAVIKKPPRFLSKQEIDALFPHITLRFQPFFYTMIYTGVRVGELFLFTWDDIDLKNNLIYVRTKGTRTERKMRSRAIPLHQKVIWSFQEREKLQEHKKYVFTTQEGKIFDRQVLRKLLNRSLKKADIKNVNLHTFRHTFASLLAQSGKVTLHQISEWLGHKSIIQTQIYAHLIPVPNDNILNEIF